LCAFDAVDTGDSGLIANALLGQVNTALAPLAPFFTVLEFTKVVLDCVNGIPDAIGGNPTTLLQAAGNLGVVVDKLLKLFPQYSVPAMAIGIVGVIVESLIGIKQQMAALAQQRDRVVRALTVATNTNNPQLLVIANCANDNLTTQLANTNASYAPLNRMIGVLNILLELANIPCIPVLGALPGIGSEADAVIDTTIEILQTLLAAIPGTGLDLPALPPTGSCA
jgi:hypothetical protein